MDNDRSVVLTEAQLKDLMTEAVNEAFVKLGIDATDPLKMQKNFQYLDDLVETTDVVKKHGLITLVGLALSATVAAVWIGFKGMVGGG